MSVIYKYK